MIEERATVVRLDGDHAWVAAERQSSCGQCAAKTGCGTSALGDFLARRRPTLKVRNTCRAAVGDDVILGIAEDAFLTGSLIIYGAPLLLLLVGAATGSSLGAGLRLEGEGASILGGLLGFLCGVLWARWRTVDPALRDRVRPVMLKRMTGPPTVS